MTIEIRHDTLAHQLIADGTHAHRLELEELAQKVRDVAPGAAAALVDWAGSEVARLRAYGVAREAMRQRVVDRYAELQRETLARGAYQLIA